MSFPFALLIKPSGDKRFGGTLIPLRDQPASGPTLAAATCSRAHQEPPPHLPAICHTFKENIIRFQTGCEINIAWAE